MPYNELHEYCKGVPTEAGLEERLSRDPKAGLEQDETGKTPLHYLCANYNISVQLIATYLKHAPEAARIEANEKAREAAAAEEAEYEEEAEEGDDDEEEIALVTFDADDDVAHATRSWLKREGFWREGDLCSVGTVEGGTAGAKRKMTPIKWAQRQLGQGHPVYDWLEAHGAMVPGEEKAVKRWLMKQGFKKGNFQSHALMDGSDRYKATPLERARDCGEWHVYAWLHVSGGVLISIAK
jgi:hypothetical protein